MNCARAAYEAAGLTRATKRAFHKETQLKAWGAQVDGKRGRIGFPLEYRRDVWKLLEHLWSNALQAGVGNVGCGELNSKSMSVKAGDVEKAIDKKMGEPIINALAANWTEQQQEGNCDKEPHLAFCEGHRLPTIPHAVCSCEWGWGGQMVVLS